MTNLPTDFVYIDPDISCFTGTSDSPTGMMLVHRTPSGNFRVEYIGLLGNDTSPIPAMSAFVIDQARQVGEKDAVVEFSIFMDEFNQLMEKLCPRRQSALLVTASLSGEFAGTGDIDGDMIDTLVNVPDDELQEMFDQLTSES